MINNHLLNYIASLFFILCSLFFSPVRAQVGTWKNYMSYAEPQQIVKAGDNIFVRASNDLYLYNLTDHSITTYDKANGLSDTYIDKIGWNDKAKKLIIIYQNSNIDLLDFNDNITNISALYRKAMTADKTVDSLTFDGIYAYLYARFGIVKVNMERGEISDTYTPQHPEYPTSLPVSTINNDYDNYIDLVKTLKPDGPQYNRFYESKCMNGNLYTVAGYFLTGKGDLGYPGIVQVWDGSEWQNYQERLDTITGYAYVDNNCIDVDPTDNSHVAVGGRCGLYEFKNGKLLKYHNQQNSPLHGAMDGSTELDNSYTLINGIKYDDKGNLWVINSQSKGVNLLQLKKDGEWVDYYQKELADNSGVSLVGMRDIIFDRHGRMWFVNSNWSSPALFCYDIDNNKTIKYDNFTNQDGVAYVLTSVNSVREDLEGNIWVGTSQGPFMLTSNDAGIDNAEFQQIKVPRNDGSDYADYLLSGVNISSIAIDGGNRKWFGTDGAGVFLVSSDNMEQLQYFTEEKTNLLSDKIMSVSINNQTGEVFFLTNVGMCSYLSDATESTTEMTNENVYAYPNPVTPDFTGLITIKGLTLNADVKICSSSGKIIAEGRSNGGMFTWDGNDKDGRRVASGVYMVMTATNDGKKGAVCKIAIIR